MKDILGNIIYVGKAKSLKKRLKQYFLPGSQHGQKVKSMLKQVIDYDYILVNNEAESLVLESNLIKQYKPKYNILLRDDKQYPYIKITNEAFPQVVKTRELDTDGGIYYGPYPGANQVNLALQTLHEHFPIRMCHYHLPEQHPKRPCLNYQIGQCIGPCTGDLNQDKYQILIDEIQRIIEGKGQFLLGELTEEMKAYSKDLNFEQAGMIRDKIDSIKSLWVKQVVDQSNQGVTDGFQDVIGIARINDLACIQIFFIRAGKIVGRDVFFLEQIDNASESMILTSFIEQFYSGQVLIPPYIIVSRKVEDVDLLSETLSALKGTKVQIVYPQRGEKREQAMLADKNAKDALNRRGGNWIQKIEERKALMERLAKLLRIEDELIRVESYDISHISGSDAVGGMVVYENGIEKRSEYRRFRLRNHVGGDDYHSIQQVIERRFRRGLNLTNTKKGNVGFANFPDLILIDGGKSQVNAVKEIIFNLGLFIPICGMVKDDSHQTRALFYENREISIKDDRDIYVWVSRVQSEVHRYAIDYHRNLRSKRTISSLLDDIPGIGQKRKIALLKYFGDINKIMEASIEQLTEVPNISIKTAEKVYAYLQDYQQQQLKPKQ